MFVCLCYINLCRCHRVTARAEQCVKNRNGGRKKGTTYTVHVSSGELCFNINQTARCISSLRASAHNNMRTGFAKPLEKTLTSVMTFCKNSYGNEYRKRRPNKSKGRTVTLSFLRCPFHLLSEAHFKFRQEI